MRSIDSLKDIFEFILVDNNRRRVERIKDTLEEANIVPLVINGGFYCKRTHIATLETYEKNKLPVIFLDEHFGTNELESGSLICMILREYTDEKGGILFPISPLRELQQEKWSKIFKEEEESWYVEKELHPLLDTFSIENIYGVCTEFLERREKNEAINEFKNG